MDKKVSTFAFSKENFILLAISIIVLIAGFILVSGGKSSNATEFDLRIFNTRKLLIAPIVLLFGFNLVIYAILKKPKKDLIDKKI